MFVSLFGNLRPGEAEGITEMAMTIYKCSSHVRGESRKAYTFWGRYIDYRIKAPLNAHVGVRSRIWRLRLPYFAYARSEDSGEAVRMHRLA